MVCTVFDVFLWLTCYYYVYVYLYMCFFLFLEHLQGRVWAQAGVGAPREGAGRLQSNQSNRHLLQIRKTIRGRGCSGCSLLVLPFPEIIYYLLHMRIQFIPSMRITNAYYRLLFIPRMRIRCRPPSSRSQKWYTYTYVICMIFVYIYIYSIYIYIYIYTHYTLCMYVYIYIYIYTW